MNGICCIIVWCIALFKTYNCVNITNYHGYRDFKSGYIPPFRELWTSNLLTAPSKLGCLAVSVLDKRCDGFLYDSDSGLCTGVDTRAEHSSTQSHGQQTSLSSLTRLRTRIAFYSIERTKWTGTKDIAPKRATFRLFVQTGNRDGSKSDSKSIKVSVILTGKEGSFEKELKDPTNTGEPFQGGSNDTYEFTSSDIGEIVTVRIKGEAIGMGDKWFLEKIIIEKRVEHLGYDVSVDIYLAELGDWITEKMSVFNILSHKTDTKTLRLHKLIQYTEQQ